MVIFGLIGCEESQIVTKSFRSKGLNVMSCDLKHCSGGHKEWHIKGDVIEQLYSKLWDFAIVHPPCTYLTVTGNKWLKDQPKRDSGKLVGEDRRKAQKEAIEFFKLCWNAPIKYLCLENPKGVINSIIPPSQMIHPFHFGDKDQKETYLWLKGFPKLVHIKEDDLFDKKTHVKAEPTYLGKDGKGIFFSNAISGSGNKAAELRSKTFNGIANAMADQWTPILTGTPVSAKYY